MSQIFLCGLFLTSAIITPFSADPVNIPKFVSLVIFSLLASALCLSSIKFLALQESGLFGLSLLLMIFGSIIVTLSSNSDLITKLYGVTGRNIGLLTIISLSGMALVGYLLVDASVVNRSLTTLILLTLLSASYGLLQYFGADPISWQANFGSVFGVLGNPNFQSALMGIGGIVGVGKLLEKINRFKLRIFSILYIVLMLISIYITDSVQGFLMFFLGLSVVSIGYLFKKLPHIFCGIFLTGILVGPFTLFMVLLSLDEEGFLASLGSLNQRMTYWVVGIRVWIQNPIFGTGLDSFGESFRSFRNAEDIKAVSGTITNSAHNIFIDFLANGGLALFLPFSLMVALVIRAIFRLLTRSTSNPTGTIIVIAVWIGLFTQALISPNQIALMVWFWAFAGIIVGIESRSRKNLGDLSARSRIPHSSVERKDTSLIEAKLVIVGFVSLMIALTVALPPFVASTRYLSALKSGYVEKIYTSAFIFPEDISRSLAVISALSDNGFSVQARSLALSTVERFPNSFVAWNQLYTLNTTPLKEKIDAMANMQRLDPNNPALK